MQTLKAGKPGDYNFLRPKQSASAEPTKPKQLTATDIEFMARMDVDTDDRRRSAFIAQLSARAGSP